MVGLLMDFIGDFNNTSAVDVIAFVKEVVEKFPNLRRDILQRLMSTLSNVRSGKVSRGVLWIIGEYCVDQHGAHIPCCMNVGKLLSRHRYPRGMEEDTC